MAEPPSEHVADLQRLRQTARTLAGEAEPQAALSHVLDAALLSLGASCGLISLCAAERSTLRVAACRGFDDVPSESLEAVAIAGGGTAWSAPRRVVIADVRKDPAFAPILNLAEAAGFVATHSVPLAAHGGEVVGVLTVCYAEPHVPDEREEVLLELYAQLVADFIAKDRGTEQLRSSEERFRLLADHAPVGIFLANAGGDAVYFNPAWCRLAGLSAAEASGRGWEQALHPEDRERVSREWALAVADTRPSRVEFRFLRPDGSICWLQGNAVRLRDGDRITGYIGTVVDITEQRAATDRNRMLAAIVASSEDGIVGSDLQGRITSWNQGAELLYGYTADEAIGQPVQMLLPDERQSEEPDILLRISNGERIHHFETVRLRKDGTPVDVSLTVSPILGHDGKVVGASKTARDITLRKRHEAELRRREKIYHAIGESISYGVWICDAEGRNTYASESFLNLVGLTQEECAGLGWLQAVAPEEREGVLAAWREAMAGAGEYEKRFRVRGADGEWHPVLARGVPIRDENGRIVHWAGIHLDIAAFIRTEVALRGREAQLRLVTDNAIVYLAQCDREYRLKFVNRPYAARFGRKPEDVVGESIASLIGEEAFRLVKPQIDEALLGRRVEFELELPYERVGKRWMRVIHEPERNDAGAVIGIVAVITDITARKQAEREMELARDKALAASRAKDEFLATLSHELRTPLNPVLLLASEAAADSSLPERTREDFATIRRSVELEARLIDDLLDLTRITRGKLSLNLGRQDVHAILKDALAALRSDFEQKGLQLEVELRAPEPRVWGDAVRLQQVFWNVLKNAVKFTPAGGRVQVRTRRGAEPDRICIEIQDTGIGLTAEELASVFDAFSQGEHASPGGSHRFGGVGLGLTISNTLIAMHGGSIEAVSGGRGQGALFRIDLPIARPEQLDVPEESGPAAPLLAAAGAEEPRRPRRILLVEDHEATRRALAQLLKRRQFEVLAAGSVAEARALAENAEIDLLVSDIGLPDGNGCELMAELREQRQLPGIALTGYGMDHDIVRSQAAGFLVHLTKPVAMQALDRALATVLAERT